MHRGISPQRERRSNAGRPLPSVLVRTIVTIAALSAALAGAAPSAVKPAGEPDVETTRQLIARKLIIPVSGATAASLRPGFNDIRGASRHEAIDIGAARGTPVIAADDG